MPSTAGNREKLHGAKTFAWFGLEIYQKSLYIAALIANYEEFFG
jgi:hypothetical protein